AAIRLRPIDVIASADPRRPNASDSVAGPREGRRLERRLVDDAPSERARRDRRAPRQARDPGFLHERLACVLRSGARCARVQLAATRDAASIEAGALRVAV